MLTSITLLCMYSYCSLLLRLSNVTQRMHDSGRGPRETSPRNLAPSLQELGRWTNHDQRLYGGNLHPAKHSMNDKVAWSGRTTTHTMLEALENHFSWQGSEPHTAIAPSQVRIIEDQPIALGGSGALSFARERARG